MERNSSLPAGPVPSSMLAGGKGAARYGLGCGYQAKGDVVLLEGRQDELAEAKTQRIISAAGTYHALPAWEKILRHTAEATAKALICHPDGVRYRLSRVTEHTGRSLSDPQAVTELSLALQADTLARYI